MTRLLAAAIVLALAPRAGAQPEVTRDLDAWCALYATPHGAVSGPAIDYGPALDERRPERTVTTVTTRRAATITVDYSGFTPAAQAAFQRAVDIWADHLDSPIEIRVQADFEALGASTLGQAGPFLVRDFGFGSRPDTWYPFALADAIAGRDFFPTPGQNFYDIQATFNSAFSRFYFGLDGRPGSNQIDFVTVVLHELGHGLGFVGSGEVRDSSGGERCVGPAGTGCWGFTASGRTSPFIFDRFLEDGVGTAFLDEEVYPNPSQILGDLLESEDLFVDAPTTVSVYGDRPPIWAPLRFDRGSSFSHWDENVVFGSSAALMTPLVANGEAYQDPGNITCAFFLDMGWELGSGCLALTPPPTAGETGPGGIGLALRLAGPNPFRTATTVEVARDAPGPLAVSVHDVLGRTVATVFDGAAADRARVVVDAAGLAPGVYRVRAASEGAEVWLPVTVVR
ncbi:hypothetical protein [Rubrivirga sp. IMCC45206]|uniref:hypothetical protein n=1 Tax=Rubrivirga sp. IMCC45206 TaxID=3391614 RepID=UPI00398FDD7B